MRGGKMNKKKEVEQRIQMLEGDLKKAREELNRIYKSEYPYVGFHEERIVLFEKESVGVIIADSSGSWDLGSKSKSWVKDFVPFTGTITYKNGKPVKTEVL